MTGYILSRTGTTDHPFYVRSVGLNLYSAEELLYFLYTSPALIDSEMMNSSLTRWLAQEFGLGDTAAEMDRALRMKTGIRGFVMPLFRAMGYPDQRQMNAYERRLERLENGSAAMRLKMKGDALFRNRRYGEAVSIYREAEEQLADDEKLLKEQILSSRGAARMQLLEYDEAVSDYENAYRVSRSRKALSNLLLALRVAKPKEQYEFRASELKADPKELLETDARVTALETAPVEVPEDPDGELLKIRSTYHREAGE